MSICSASQTAPLGTRVLSAVSALLIAVASIGAASEPDEELAVVGVYSEGKLDQRATGDLARLIRQNGDAARPAKPRSSVPWSCGDRACLQKVANELRSRRLIQTGVQLLERETQSYLLTIRFFDAATAQVEEREIHCDSCEPRARLERAATEISEGFLRRITSPASEQSSKAEVRPSGEELSSPVLKPISDPTPPEEAARSSIEPPSKEAPAQRAPTVPMPTPTGSVSDKTAPLKVMTALPLEVSPTAAVSVSRLRAAWVFGGMSIAFTGIAGFLSAGALYGERFCPVKYVGSRTGTVDEVFCDRVTLSTAWGLAITSATVSLLARYAGVRR